MFPIEVLQILTHIVKALEEQNILTKQVIDDQLKIHEDTINQQWRMLEKNNTFIADQNSSYHTFIAGQNELQRRSMGYYSMNERDIQPPGYIIVHDTRYGIIYVENDTYTLRDANGHPIEFIDRDKAIRYAWKHRDEQAAKAHMQRTNDGSLTLSREDLDSLRCAYEMLFDELDSIPGFLDQFAQEEKEAYENIANWREILAGREPVFPSKKATND